MGLPGGGRGGTDRGRHQERGPECPAAAELLRCDVDRRRAARGPDIGSQPSVHDQDDAAVLRCRDDDIEPVVAHRQGPIRERCDGERVPDGGEVVRPGIEDGIGRREPGAAHLLHTEARLARRRIAAVAQDDPARVIPGRADRVRAGQRGDGPHPQVVARTGRDQVSIEDDRVATDPQASSHRTRPRVRKVDGRHALAREVQDGGERRGHRLRAGQRPKVCVQQPRPRTPFVIGIGAHREEARAVAAETGKPAPGRVRDAPSDAHRSMARPPDRHGLRDVIAEDAARAHDGWKERSVRPGEDRGRCVLDEHPSLRVGPDPEHRPGAIGDGDKLVAGNAIGLADHPAPVRLRKPDVRPGTVPPVATLSQERQGRHRAGLVDLERGELVDAVGIGVEQVRLLERVGQAEGGHEVRTPGAALVVPPAAGAALPTVRRDERGDEERPHAAAIPDGEQRNRITSRFDGDEHAVECPPEDRERPGDSPRATGQPPGLELRAGHGIPDADDLRAAAAVQIHHDRRVRLARQRHDGRRRRRAHGRAGHRQRREGEEQWPKENATAQRSGHRSYIARTPSRLRAMTMR